jgi:hypothetical protein
MTDTQVTEKQKLSQIANQGPTLRLCSNVQGVMEGKVAPRRFGKAIFAVAVVVIAVLSFVSFGTLESQAIGAGLRAIRG